MMMPRHANITLARTMMVCIFFPPPSSCQNEPHRTCPNGWTQSNRSRVDEIACFRGFCDPQSWHTANETCAQLHGSLVVVNDDDDNELIRSLVQGATSIWIGLQYRIEGTMDWTWVAQPSNSSDSMYRWSSHIKSRGTYRCSVTVLKCTDGQQ
eukprot:m.305343 g.305343  ORF g.305343 m.305343 type:complete len:153 (-) comp20179_c0_seq2:2222-2680(-)